MLVVILITITVSLLYIHYLTFFTHFSCSKNGTIKGKGEEKLKIIRTIGLQLCFLTASTVSTVTWSQSANDWQSGEEIFGKICQYCHTQGVGPVLTGRNLPPVYFTTIARNGLNAMPAFRPTELSAEDLEKVADFLSQSTGEENQ